MVGSQQSTRAGTCPLLRGAPGFSALKGQSLRGSLGERPHCHVLASSTWPWGWEADSCCRCLSDGCPSSSAPASSLGLSPATCTQLPCGAQFCFPAPPHPHLHLLFTQETKPEADKGEGQGPPARLSTKLAGQGGI